MMRFPQVILLAAACTSSLAGCSTALLNANTLDLAATVNDTAVSQIVYNLAKTAANEWHLPSQVQINNGIIAARTSLSPAATDPLSSALTSAKTVATQVIAATGATTTTTTNAGPTLRTSPSVGVTGLAEDTSTWNVSPIQDPEQLIRLQLLYQYGVGKIFANELLCLYPIPEKPDSPQKSDLKVLADALAVNADESAAKEAVANAVQQLADRLEKSGQKVDAKRIKAYIDETTSKAAKKAVADRDARADKDAGKGKPKKYIRGEYPNCPNSYVRGNLWTFAALNPDLAFLTPPACCVRIQITSSTTDLENLGSDKYTITDVRINSPYIR